MKQDLAEKRLISNPRFLLDILELVKLEHWRLVREELKRVKKGREAEASKFFEARLPSTFKTKKDYLYYRELLRHDMTEAHRMLAWKLDIQELLDQHKESLSQQPRSQK